MKYILVFLALGVPVTLWGQTRTTIAPYVATDGSVEGSPMLVGASLTRERGWLGVRVSGAMDAHSLPLTSWMDREGYAKVFGGDVDGLLFLGGGASTRPVPYVVAGVGARRITDGAGTRTATSWSYGGGLRAALSPWFSLEGEARYRNPITMGAVPASSGLEVRLGAGVSWGGARRAATVAPAPVSRRLATVAAAPMTATARSSMAARTLDLADNYLGVPYRWGGNTPAQGFDCSGFVRFVFEKEGIELPRVSRDQARMGMAVPLEISAFQPGDLLAFASGGRTVDHIAIYAGNGTIIHSSSSGGGVRYDKLSGARGQWYMDHLVAARRVIGAPSRFMAR